MKKILPKYKKKIPMTDADLNLLLSTLHDWLVQQKWIGGEAEEGVQTQMMNLEQLPPKGVKRERAILELGKDEANEELLFQLVNTEKAKCKTAAQKALA